MSSGHVLTPKERDIWQKRIVSLCVDLYRDNYFMGLCYFVVQLYEYCVACEAKDENSPIKLNLIQQVVNSEDWKLYCKELYFIRCHATHSMYRKDINFDVVFNNPLYSNLIQKYFDEENQVYLQVLRSSYMSCLQEDYLL